MKTLAPIEESVVIQGAIGRARLGLRDQILKSGKEGIAGSTGRGPLRSLTAQLVLDRPSYEFSE
jgi:hypothetical protein